MRSKFEEKIAKELTQGGVDFTYESKTVYYSLVHSYTVDFVLPNGVMIETKGYFTAEDRAKHLAVRKQIPNLDIRFVFMRAKTKIHKNSKTTYADWCNRHGFRWAEGSIPQEWIDGERENLPSLKEK